MSHEHGDNCSCCHGHKEVEFELKRRTTEELSQIAVDMVAGKVFCDMHLQDQDKEMVKTIFLPIGLGALSDWEEDKIKNIGMVFEYLDKSIVPLIVDEAIPAFSTMQLMHKDDMEEFMKIGASL